jgi:myo-inositol-1(or 4)-monophosphatase
MKMVSRDLILEIAEEIRHSVKPYLFSQEGKEIGREAHSGDVTFRLDEIAEEALFKFLKRRGLNLAYFSEDKGLVEFGTPEVLLIVDPIDGTRGAKCGFECCVVSIAAVPYESDRRIKDVELACVAEIKEDRVFVGQRGRSVHILQAGKKMRVRQANTKTDLSTIAFAFELCGRPAKEVVGVIGDLIDLASLRGGVFTFSSSAYALTRLLTGQLDAYVDVANRIYRERVTSRKGFLSAGGGRTIFIFPYDIAAAHLLLKEAGYPITDAYGGSLEDVLLTDVRPENGLSCVATSGDNLHQKILEFINSHTD